MATLNIKSFPEELYQALGEVAKREHRSLSGEVIYLLQWAVQEALKEKLSIQQLRGLGKKYWKEVNTTDHIKHERDAWD